MKLRLGSDAILVGLNTVVKDDPSLTIRNCGVAAKPLRRIVLDPLAETPLQSKVIIDACAAHTTIVVTRAAPKTRIAALAKHVSVVVAPARQLKIDLQWLLKKLGSEKVTSLLVEGGGETNAAFLLQGVAHRIEFFYAPIVLGGRDAPKGVAGDGIRNLEDKITLRDVVWRKLAPDLLLTARVDLSS